MKKILLTILIAAHLSVFAQKQSFDLITYDPLKGWTKQSKGQMIQYTKENKAKTAYCIITVYKSLEASDDAKNNFDLSWETLVKQTLDVTVPAEMQPGANDNGWDIQSGYTTFEKEGNKGIALLVSASGFNKVMNVLILTNTDVYQSEISAFLESISLKKPVTKPAKNIIPARQEINQSLPIETGAFKFNTTNFDDGWTSIIQEDWVQVTKDNMKVLIHYPNKKVDEYNPVLLDGLKEAWDVLVAPRYNVAGSAEFKPISGWQSIEFAEADATEKTTGKTVHVVLFKMNYSGGNGKYLEFITPDKQLFEQQFGAYHPDTYGWEKMEKMVNYNKFAVAATDLKGKWTTKFSGTTQYVNIYTGLSAGMDTHASNEAYNFGTGNTYKWDLAVASGPVGSIKFQSVKSIGKFSMKDNWHIYLSDIEGKPRTYDVHFSCVKGLRILWIDDNAFAKVE